MEPLLPDYRKLRRPRRMRGPVRRLASVISPQRLQTRRRVTSHAYGRLGSVHGFDMTEFACSLLVGGLLCVSSPLYGRRTICHKSEGETSSSSPQAKDPVDLERMSHRRPVRGPPARRRGQGSPSRRRGNDKSADARWQHISADRDGTLMTDNDGPC